MRFRKLRIAFSATCLIACVLLVVLWVRSYSFRAELTWRYDTPNSIHVISLYGRVAIDAAVELPKKMFRNYSGGGTIDYWGPSLEFVEFYSGYESLSEFLSDLSRRAVIVPYWAMIVAVATVAPAPWFRWRFSLRTLLIATTIIAVVLGIIVWMSQTG